MNPDDRNALPPLAAGRDRAGEDPGPDAFDDKETPPPGGSGPSATPPEPVAGPDQGLAPEKAERRPEFVGTGMFWGLVVGVLLAVFIITFAAQNTRDTTIRLIVWEWSSPLFVAILISLIVGIVLAEAAGLFYRSRRRRRLADKVELQRLRGRR